MLKYLMRFFAVIFILINIINVCHGDTITLNWKNEDGTTNQSTTCESGGNLVLPNTPTKPGYDFVGWWANYVPIEYLKNTGTQYIDTGLSISSNIKIEIKFQSFVSGWLLGATDGSNGRWGATPTQTSLIWYSKKTSVTDETYYNPNGINIAEFDYANGMTINGHYLPFASQQSYGNVSNHHLYIFFADGSSVNIQSHAVYYFKIYNNNVLVRDFIPVIDSNAVPCMYDKVESKFYYNAGTGDFISGPILYD